MSLLKLVENEEAEGDATDRMAISCKHYGRATAFLQVRHALLLMLLDHTQQPPSEHLEGQKHVLDLLLNTDAIAKALDVREQ